jgi:Tfp pilus assembly protein PilX
MKRTTRRGAILVVALVTLLVVTLLAGVVVHSYLQGHRQLRQQQNALQAQWLAESALARAAAQLRANPAYAGETWQVELAAADNQPAAGSAEIKLEPVPDQRQMLRINVLASFPGDELHRVLVERSLVFTRPENSK